MLADLKVLIQSLTFKGFLSLKKLLGHAFPKEGQEGPKVPDQQWMRIAGWIAPVLAILIASRLIISPPSLVDFLFQFFPSITSLVYLVVIGYVVFFVGFLLVCSLIMKLKGKNPVALLCMTLLPPAKGLLFFLTLSCIFTFSGLKQAMIQKQFCAKQRAFVDSFNKEREQMQRKREEFRAEFKKNWDNFGKPRNEPAAETDR